MVSNLVATQGTGQLAVSVHKSRGSPTRAIYAVTCHSRRLHCTHCIAHSHALPAKTLREHTANLLLSLSLAAACSLYQPASALADVSSGMPPSTAAPSSSIASQAASRTVVDVVSGEESVLNEANTPDNRDSPDTDESRTKQDPVAETSEVPSTQASAPQQVYLDLNVDGQPKGRLVIQLDGEAPVGTKRFADLSKGLNGVGYRLSKFDGIAQGFIKNSGQRSLTYDASNISKVAGGDTVEELEAEMEESTHRHDVGGIVSLIVKDTRTKIGKTKLVAYNGKLIRVEEPTPGESPNGSGFVITTQAAPDLDATNLVIGHVVDGMEVVNQLTKLPTVKTNNSVFFRAGKFLGDKRADVAEKGFGRPFLKVLVSASGVLEK